MVYSEIEYFGIINKGIKEFYLGLTTTNNIYNHQ
jgi:hypothetical protein